MKRCEPHVRGGKRGETVRRMHMNQAGDRIEWTRYLQYAVSSDVGMRRLNNQDSCAVSLAPTMSQWMREGHLFMVADGMGAHAAGELASKLAADHVVHLYRKYLDMSPPDALERAVREANLEINRRGQENLDFRNMGTTCSVLLLLPQGALVAHVGDSRVYRLRNGRLQQLTFDHSLVWELREAGQIAADDAAPGIPKNVITRSLGPHPSVRIDLEGPFPLENNDTFLLCSDGLTGCVTDTEIAAIVAFLDPAPAAQLLTDLANLRGGPDNITVMVARVASQELASSIRNASPLQMRASQRSPDPRQSPALLWIASGVFWLLAVVLIVFQQLPWAWLMAIAGAIVLAVAWIMRSGKFGSHAVTLSGGRTLGRGPYRDAEVLPESQFAAELQRFVRNVSESAAQQQWPLHEEARQEFLRLANTPLDPAGLSDALDQLAHAVHRLQEAFREHVHPELADR